MKTGSDLDIYTTTKPERKKLSVALDRLELTDDQLKTVQEELSKIIVRFNDRKLVDNYASIIDRYSSDDAAVQKFSGVHITRYLPHDYELDIPLFFSEDAQALRENLEAEFSSRQFDLVQDLVGNLSLPGYCLVPQQTMEDLAVQDWQGITRKRYHSQEFSHVEVDEYGRVIVQEREGVTSYGDLHGFFDLALLQAAVTSTRKSIHAGIKFYKNKIRLTRLVKMVNKFFIDKSRLLKTRIKKSITRIDALSDDSDANESGFLQIPISFTTNHYRYERRRKTHHHQYYQ